MMLPDRLKQFGLELSPEKSRLMEFGRKVYLEGKEEGSGRLYVAQVAREAESAE